MGGGTVPDEPVQPPRCQAPPPASGSLPGVGQLALMLGRPDHHYTMRRGAAKQNTEFQFLQAARGSVAHQAASTLCCALASGNESQTQKKLHVLRKQPDAEIIPTTLPTPSKQPRIHPVQLSDGIPRINKRQHRSCSPTVAASATRLSYAALSRPCEFP